MILFLPFFQKMVRNYKLKTDRGKADGGLMKKWRMDIQFVKLPRIYILTELHCQDMSRNTKLDRLLQMMSLFRSQIGWYMITLLSYIQEANRTHDTNCMIQPLIHRIQGCSACIQIHREIQIITFSSEIKSIKYNLDFC